MKRLQLILIAILSFSLVFTSCEEDQVGPTLDVSQAVAPGISTPTSGSLVLLKSEAEMVFEITWTAANYKLDNIPFVKYNLVMAYSANNSSITLASTNTLVYSTTYQLLNQKVLEFGVNPEEAGDFVFTVVASVSDNSSADDLLSSPVNLTITPYDDAPPPANPIYLLGNATAAGWSNTAALEMTHIEAGAYEIVATLTGGSGQFIKFIADLGKWAPQWGTDGSGTWNSGPLIYRPTESVPDPAAIPAPPTSGDYHIVADTAQLSYTVTAVASKLFINTTGENYGRVEMAKVKPMVFTTPVNVQSGKDLFINFDENSSHTVFYNIESIEKPSRGKTIFSYIDMHSSGVIVPTRNLEGEYILEIDMYNLTYRFTNK